MKQTFKTMLALMAGAMVLTACNKDDIIENVNEQNPSELKPMTFYAAMEGQDGVTRATIDGLDIKWEANDKISIFDGATENNGNQQFSLIGGENTTSGTFKGTAKEYETTYDYYALYPYVETKIESRTVTEEEAMAAAGSYSFMVLNWKDMWAMMSTYVEEQITMYISSPENQAIILAYVRGEDIGTNIGPQRNSSDQLENVVLPAVQTATAGSADPKAMLMIAKSEDAGTLKFKNVCAYVKVTPEFDCTSIVLKSNGTESLAGTVTLGLDTDGDPTTAVTADGTNVVILSGAIKANNTYYIAVRPQTLASRFTIYFKTTDGMYNRYKKSAKKSVIFTRNKVLNLGELGISDLTPAPDRGTAAVKAEAGIDGNMVNWIQLWENGPKWAMCNVGVTDGKAESFGSAFQWATDIATTEWGSAWRMPTSDEFNALIANCTFTITTQNGVSGALFTGKADYSDNSIFLPIVSATDSYYWSSTKVDDTDARRLIANQPWVNVAVFGSTYHVRAVLAE